MKMPNPRLALALLLVAAAPLGCSDAGSGPIAISAVGGPPRLVNPNLEPLEPPSALLLEATAQGLVRFDAGGQVEPALAQSWIVSDDGLRYTFRIARSRWAGGAEVTAEQVAARLTAAVSRASRNPLKPLLIVIDRVEAMTGNVLEISLKAPRPNFLQLLAQPELAIIRERAGTGPFAATDSRDGGVLLSMHRSDEEAEEERAHPPDTVLRGERAAIAIARFAAGRADLVTGGGFGTLPVARAARLPAGALRLDPVNGLFGLAFANDDGVLADPAVRRALAMAIDRGALGTAMAVPNLQPRITTVPTGIQELPAPAEPVWAPSSPAERRAIAERAVVAASGGDTVTLSVAMPDDPGYRLVFAHLRRDWRAIGVTAERVAPGAEADLVLIDAVAPANLSTWYLRRFSCDASAVCSVEADAALDAARLALTAEERRSLLAQGDRLLTELTVFIPLTAPVRWSLVSPRLTGFQPNPFGRRFPGSLLAASRRRP